MITGQLRSPLLSTDEPPMSNQNGVKLQITVSKQVEQLLAMVANKRGETVSAVGRDIVTEWALESSHKELERWQALESLLLNAVQQGEPERHAHATDHS